MPHAKSVQTDPLLAAFDFADVNRMQIGLFRERFLAHSCLIAVVTDRFAKDFEMLLGPRHGHSGKQDAEPGNTPNMGLFAPPSSAYGQKLNPPRMNNSKLIRPRVQDLNEGIRRPEDIRALKMDRLMVEPKFDGSFVYITRDAVAGRTALCTKDGNELRLSPAIQNFIIRHFELLTEHFLFETELEPVPWSEANKVVLNGNLYSGREMPFSIRLVVHDVLPMNEIERPRSTARERHALLRALAGVIEGVNFTTPFLWDKSEKVSICITPCREATAEEVVQLFRDGWEQGKAQKRVMFDGSPYEGLVLIDPQSVHKGGRTSKWKVKPFHSLDIRVTDVRERHGGKVPIYEVHGQDTKSDASINITSGISPAIFAQLKRARSQHAVVIVEVEVSSLRELQSANPTIQSIRFDKMGSPTKELETATV